MRAKLRFAASAEHQRERRGGQGRGRGARGPDEIRAEVRTYGLDGGRWPWTKWHVDRRAARSLEEQRPGRGDAAVRRETLSSRARLRDTRSTSSTMDRDLDWPDSTSREAGGRGPRE
jgi:hypothetical protein